MKKKYNSPILTVSEISEEDIIMISTQGFILFGDIELDSQEYNGEWDDLEDYEE